MSHHLTMLGYEMNEAALSFGHGAPPPTPRQDRAQLQQARWIKGIDVVAHFSEVGGGSGGYIRHDEFFGYRR
jgi:methionine sulfoxide reductase catalytic subunit